MKRPSIVPVLLSFILFVGIGDDAVGQSKSNYSQASLIGEGWAKNSINTVKFRQGSVTSTEDIQYAAYYDPQGNMILAQRKFGAKNWKKHKTKYDANVQDAHNAISIGVDGNGVLHIAWGMHGDRLKYAHSNDAGGLALTSPKSMTGKKEDAVTYPRFYRLSDGDLLFMYRHGQSGAGDIMLNRYDIESQQWQVVQHPLISGEGERNAYINDLAVDNNGGWHLSWTWRTTWDVATNHNIMYAFSPDEGQNWQSSEGRVYSLPITKKNAEVACRIPKNSELINQTSMAVDKDGHPIVASYWQVTGDSVPQFHILWNDDSGWNTQQISNRTNDFSLSGGGTKRIPVSRPQVIAGNDKDTYIIYRDFERQGGISVAMNNDPNYQNWKIIDIYEPSIGLWEPTLDLQAWKNRREVHLFGQRVGQGDGEQLEQIRPQPVFILKWIPPEYRK